MMVNAGLLHLASATMPRGDPFCVRHLTTTVYKMKCSYKTLPSLVSHHVCSHAPIWQEQPVLFLPRASVQCETFNAGYC